MKPFVLYLSVILGILGILVIFAALYIPSIDSSTTQASTTPKATTPKATTPKATTTKASTPQASSTQASTTTSTTEKPATSTDSNISDPLAPCQLVRPYERIRQKCSYNTDDNTDDNTNGICPKNLEDDWYYTGNTCISSNSIPKEPVYYDTELYIINVDTSWYLDDCGHTPTTNESKQRNPNIKTAVWKIYEKDVSGSPYVKYGDILHIRNQESNKYLDTNGRGSSCTGCTDFDGLCGSLSDSKTRDGNSGSWVIESIDGEKEGDIVYAGDNIRIRNLFDETAYFEACGYAACGDAERAHATRCTPHKNRTGNNWRIEYTDDYKNTKQRYVTNTGLWQNI